MPISNPINPTFDAPSSIIKSNSFGGQTTEIDNTEVVELIGINYNRSALTIINTGENTALIDVVEDIQATDYMFALPPGRFYEMPTQGIYIKEIYATTLTGSTTLAFRDFSS